MIGKDNITAEDVAVMDRIIGSDNWTVIGFSPEDQKYKTYVKLVDKESLYTLLIIMREIVENMSMQLHITEGRGLSGNC